MCLICDRIEMIKNGTNPYFVKELETGYVVIGDHQHFHGYTLFLYKHHGDKTELFMGDAHLHWHLFPRRTGDIGNCFNNGRGPVWSIPMDVMYSDDNRPTAEELEEMKRKLREELEKLM